MKLKSTFIVLVAAVALSAIFAFNGSDSTEEVVKTYYHRSLDGFMQEVKSFKAISAKFASGSATAEDVQERFKAMRLAFKEAEILYAYLDPEFVKDHINGAPLYKHERNAPKVVVIEPKGLQRLEEVVYGELETKDGKATLGKLSEELEARFESSIKYQKSLRITDRLVLEATRAQLVRIFTLNVTGFDTPAGENTMEEAALALEAVNTLMQPYLEFTSVKTEYEKAISRGAKLLIPEADFDSFDRMAFLKEVINPLYAVILDIHQELGIETMYEADMLPVGWNYESRNIFSEDFLDREFYGGLYVGENSKEITDLGRILFFDPVLSNNNDRACASCHHPDKAFTDGREKSIAMNFQGTVSRNSPSLVNAVFAEKYFYDLRADRLANQMEHVIFDHKEFATDYKGIFEKLGQSTEYVELFSQAFPEMAQVPISKHTLTTAMAAYVSSLVSFDSPFDQYVRGEKDELDQAAYDGFNIFMGKAACGTCHFAPVFSGLVPPNFEESETEVLGVPLLPGDSGFVEIDSDPGRAASKRLSDESWVYYRSFKTPTVRNVALTAPYMHNGAYPDLESVLEFYDRGGGIGHGLEVPNQTLPPDKLNLSDYEKKALIAFMESLTATTGVDDQPKKLPHFDKNPDLNTRSIGGAY